MRSRRTPRRPRRQRSLNEVIGLTVLPLLLGSAVSGAAVWLSFHVRPSSAAVWIGVHAYVGLVGAAIVLAKLAVGCAAWHRRTRRRTSTPVIRRQNLLTGLLVLTVTTLYVSGIMLNANATPGGNGTYKDIHLYAALAGVPLVTEHLARYLRRARTVVARTLASAAEEERAVSRRRLLLGAALGLVAWGSVRAVDSAARTVGISGPNDFPITLTAAGSDQPDPESWRLHLEGDISSPRVLTLADLRTADRRRARYPLNCVTGWSATRTWGGVPLRDLIAQAAPTGQLLSAVLTSTTGYQVALLSQQIDDPRTMIALQVDGVDLAPEHGFPARAMAPGVVGEKCVKWVERITVVCA